MDSDYKLYLQRAGNEIELGGMIFQLSTDKDLQKEVFNVTKTDTYFSAVISHAYFSIFYAAKAYLLKKGVNTKPPEEHKKTFNEFKKLVDAGIVDVELLKIYQEMVIKADTLLGIFSEEKNKRGKFTYRRIAQANLEPAKASLDRAKTFFRHINMLVE